MSITYNFCFMQDPRIPNFYLTNLESGPFLDDFDEPPCPKTPRRDRFSRNPLFWGPSLTPRAAESVSPAKNYMQGGKWALKISRQSVQRVTSYDTFLKWHTDGQTDTRTKTNHFSTTTEFFFACMWVGRRETLQNLPNFYLFTLWRITVCNAWFWAW